MKKYLLTALITFCMCWSTSLWADERRVIEKAVFSEAQFSEIAFFDKVHFLENGVFFNCKFSKEAIFQYAQFSKVADFTYTRFSEIADFWDTTLPDTLIFYRTESVKEIDLSNTILDSAKVVQGRKCKIDLRNASIENFHLTYDNFQILKPDSVLSKQHFQELNSVYEKLLKNFKERGYTSSYESLDKEYKAFLFTQNPYHGTFTHGLNIVLNGVNKLWYDYGYAKWYIFVYIIGFVVLFSLINWFLFPHLLKAYNIKTITKHLPYQYINPKNMFTRKVFKLSFFYTCLVFFGLKMDTSALNFDKGKAVLYLFFVYAAGLFCLAYLTNFIISSNLIGG